MEEILLEFIATMDSSVKKYMSYVGQEIAISKLTIHQLHYIDAIGALGEPTITNIADKLQITKASVTIGINKLVTSGFVTKSQSSEDRRVIHVHLTPEAQQIVGAKTKALSQYCEFIHAELSEEEGNQLQSILTKLVKQYRIRK